MGLQRQKVGVSQKSEKIYTPLVLVALYSRRLMLLT